MTESYSRAFLLEKINAASSDMALFYKQPFVNYGGRTTNTGELYTEVVAEWCLDHLDMIKSISSITREVPYKTDGHDGNPPSEPSNRTEELIAMAMYRQRGLPIVGLILDYQTPLKNKRSDHVGKIDLLAYDGKVARILELKEPESSESMLRCVLEGYTYLKTVDEEKLCSDFGLPDNTEVKSCPFVFCDSKQHREMQEDRPNLKALMRELDVEPLYIKKFDSFYGVVA